jgi:PAS domain S-box-containing protein
MLAHAGGLAEISSRMIRIKDEQFSNYYIMRFMIQNPVIEVEEVGSDFFENSSELIQIVSPEGKILFANRAWLETLDYTRGDLPELDISQIIAPDHIDHCSRVLHRLITGVDEGVVELDAAFVSKRGRRIEVEGIINVRHRNGAVVATRGIFRNVTVLRGVERAERIRTEQTLRFLTALLRLRDHDALDLMGKIRLATEECAQVLGVSRASVWLFDDAREKIFCADLFLADASRHEAGAMLTAEQFPACFEAIHYHMAVAAKGAQTRPAARDFDDADAPGPGITSMLDSPVLVDGSFMGALCCGHAGSPRRWTREEEEFVTGVAFFIMHSLEAEKRRRAESLSRESEERFRVMFQNSPDAIFVNDHLSGEVLDANPAACQLHKLAHDRLVGRRMLDLVPPDEREAVEKGYQALITGECSLMESFSWTSDGLAVPVEITCKRIVFSGRPALLLNARDVTERRKSEAAQIEARSELEQRVQERTVQLAEANKQLQVEMSQRERLQMRMLLAIEQEQERIGQDLHDGVCQILTGAKFRAELLGKKLRAAVDVTPSDSDAIESLLMEGIRQARGVAYGLNPVKWEDGGLMKALEVLARGASTEAGPACVFHCPEPVLFDDHLLASHLYRIAQEALQNALKHARSKNIAIELTESDRVVTLAITDDGCGISLPQSMPTGMGFSNMRRRAGMIGGKVEIKPADCGGTTVVCRVRRADASVEGAA